MLPTTFSGVKVDEQGRRFVVHKPSGVIYYVREDDARFKGKHGAGPVTVFSKSAKAAKKKAKQARHADRLARGDLFDRQPAVLPRPAARPLGAVAGTGREYFATFHPVEGVE